MMCNYEPYPVALVLHELEFWWQNGGTGRRGGGGTGSIDAGSGGGSERRSAPPCGALNGGNRAPRGVHGAEAEVTNA